MDCRVVVEAAVPVYDVESPDEAVRIAISKTGEMLNPDLNYVEIDMGDRRCPHCGDPLETAFIAADEGLVALELEMTVFNVEREEHASRIARKEIGQRLEKIPLSVLEVEVIEDDASESSDENESSADTSGDDQPAEASDDSSGDEPSDDSSGDEPSDDSSGDEPSDDSSGDEPSDDSSEDQDDGMLPEFEDLLDE